MDAGTGNVVKLGRVRVFLVDDSAVMRAILRRLIEGEPDIAVVGEAADGLAALTSLPPTRPDVALVDVHMPGLGGVALTRWLRDNHPDVRVIALTSENDWSHREAMRQAGAVEYQLKSVTGPDLVAAIHRAHRLPGGHSSGASER